MPAPVSASVAAALNVNSKYHLPDEWSVSPRTPVSSGPAAVGRPAVSRFQIQW